MSGLPRILIIGAPSNADNRLLEQMSSSNELVRAANPMDAIERLAKECIDICELTEFSFAMPVAMRDIHQRMIEIRENLEGEQADEDLVALEQSVVDDLQALLDAMKRASRPTNQKNSQCQGGCCSNRNKLLAEVKMLYWMQKSCARETKRVHEQKANGKVSDQEFLDRTQRLHEQQEKIRGITDKLRELTTPDFVKGEVI